MTRVRVMIWPLVSSLELAIRGFRCVLYACAGCAARVHFGARFVNVRPTVVSATRRLNRFRNSHGEIDGCVHIAIEAATHKYNVIVVIAKRRIMRQ